MPVLEKVLRFRDDVAKFPNLGIVAGHDDEMWVNGNHHTLSDEDEEGNSFTNEEREDEVSGYNGI